MHLDFAQEVVRHAEEPLSRAVLLRMLRNYRRPNDKIHELVRGGQLMPIRRGLYVPGYAVGVKGPDPLVLANSILTPSYVSLETALSFWGLIPERVYGRMCVTPRAGRFFDTPLGRFTYIHLPSPYYDMGITDIRINERQTVRLATPEKALCDKVVVTVGLQLRSVRQAMAFLTEDLRLDEEDLSSLRVDEIGRWLEVAPKASSLEKMMKAIDGR